MKIPKFHIGTKLPVLFLLFFICISPAFSQKNKKGKSPKVEEKKASPLEKLSIPGLKFRSIGPAFTSGRIADFAVNPHKKSEYYVATASGGVWKTRNAGTTYTPVFDSQGSYSIGCVTLDPNNSSVVWVGTGENNNQRSVGYGDGIYKSEDGGTSWKHMGLKHSEHIGSIIVDPRNSDVVYVAAIGPLWKEGGDRGVFKTVDGGVTWDTVLYISKHTGVNDIVMDPRNPDVLYATAFQRRRHVFTYLGGGPESGIYKTTDGGKNWKKVNAGLPSVDIGRIGLTISPADPEVIYAIVEAAQNKGGFYRSVNRGALWEKRSSYSTSGNYYQEIVADPADPDKIYAMDTWMHYSTDGGKTFKMVGEDTKHVDNHAMWIDPDDSSHWLVGCDGGIYETYDDAATWQFKSNLPVTQFYKVAVDNAEPFYNIYGGTQDNFSMGGPSRTITDHGIVNSEWFITHGGDGFESQIDPENPDIVYAQSQYGVLVRYDKRSGEELGIQPKERKGENTYRWNWDAPLAVSHHKDGRLYFAANKLFRSDDRGNSWEVISDDLTRQIDRNTLKVMDRIWGIDAVAKNRSTSPYGTIVAFSESRLNKDLLYVGTDDGLIQITEDGGKTWHQSENFPGVPARTYVNAIVASQHDENIVYAAFNHHKYGDFKPYVYKSMDKGRTWSALTSNLPERGSAYSIAEDHVDPNLLFVGTEFGLFFTNDGGKYWKQIKAGLPTVAIRDIAIQERENDLVLASFGRGFFVLDDYTSLRQISKPVLDTLAHLFSVREALMFEKSLPLGLPGKSFQGDAYYSGENLGPAALFTYYLKEDIKTAADRRREAEAKAKKEGKDNPYPSYDVLKAEREAGKPELLLTIRDGDGRIVKKLSASTKAGVHRLKWDLRYAPKNAIRLSPPGFYNPFAGKEEGSLVVPGTYTATLSKIEHEEVTILAGPLSFNVKALNNTTLPASDREEKVVFQQEVADLSRALEGAQATMGTIRNELRHIEVAAKRAALSMSDIIGDISGVKLQLAEINRKLNGDAVASTLDIGTPPSVSNRIGFLMYEQFYSTGAPTKTHKDSYAIAKEEFAPLLRQVRKIIEQEMKQIQQKLEEVGAPYTPGRIIELDK